MKQGANDKAVKPKDEKVLAQEFVDEYQELCKKHNLQLVTTPAWRVSNDTGDWRLILQQSVGKQTQQNN